MEDISPFSGASDTYVWDFCPGFQSQGGFLSLHALSPAHNGILRFTSSATPADPLLKKLSYCHPYRLISSKLTVTYHDHAHSWKFPPHPHPWVYSPHPESSSFLCQPMSAIQAHLFWSIGFPPPSCLETNSHLKVHLFNSFFIPL